MPKRAQAHRLQTPRCGGVDDHDDDHADDGDHGDDGDDDDNDDDDDLSLRRI